MSGLTSVYRRQLGAKVKLLPQINRYYKFVPKYKEHEYVGAELEVEGYNLPYDSINHYWKVTGDDSLRVPTGGNGAAYEYILKKPVSPEHFKEKVFPYLSNKLNEGDSQTEFSMRCSTHIHIGVHELYLYQVFLYVGLYNIFEDLFWPLCGRRREGYLFCVSNGVSEKLSEIMAFLARTGRLHSAFPSDSLKYSSVNLRTMKHLGTVEFRAMEGTDDKERIATWVDILVSLRNYAASIKPEEAGTLLNIMSAQGPLKFFANCVGGEDSPAYKAVIDSFEGDKAKIQEIIFEGINRNQQIFYEPMWSEIKYIDELPEDRKGISDRVGPSRPRLGDLSGAATFDDSVFDEPAIQPLSHWVATGTSSSTASSGGSSFTSEQIQHLINSQNQAIQGSSEE